MRDIEPPLRPGALCIPPHLHGAIFAPSIDAELPRTSTSTHTHTHTCAPRRPAPLSLSLCADRPTPADRRILAGSATASPARRILFSGPPSPSPKRKLLIEVPDDVATYMTDEARRAFPFMDPELRRPRLEPRSAYAEHSIPCLPPYPRLEPRSAKAEHSIPRLPPYEDAEHPRLEPRSAYAERTPVVIPAYSERERVRLEPRSAYAEHVAVEIPPEPPVESLFGGEKDKEWLAHGGLPIPTAASIKPKPKSWLRRLLVLLLVLVSIPATWFLLSADRSVLSSLNAFSHSLSQVSEVLSPAAPSGPIEVPPIDYEWWKRCTDLLVIPKGTYTNRIDKLQRALDGAAWVAEPGPSVEYFLGAFGPHVWKPSERPFLIAAKDGKITILTPAFEESRARLLKLPDEIAERVTWVSWTEDESPYAALVCALGPVEIVIDPDVRHFIAAGIRGAQGNERSRSREQMRDVRAAVASIREVKEEREVGLLRCANEATLHAIRKTRARMYIGIQESQAREMLYQEMNAVGLTDYSALVLFGPNAALPHGSGTDRFLGKNEFALIDAGGRWGGYIADITRTFFLPDSEIPEAHQWVWEIVRAAQRAPANLLRYIEPGEDAYFSWLDDRARETVKKGMAALGVPPQKGREPDYTVFTHRTGHGIGLEGHESPYVVQGPLGERQLLPGHTFTLEPGVYVPLDSEVGDESIKGLGVRLEDTVVLVEKDGRLALEWLTGPVEKWGDV